MDFPSLPAEDLVRQCATSGGERAWEEFVRRYDRLIATTVLRACLMRGVTDRAAMADLVQEAYLKLCANGCRVLRDYKPLHPDGFPAFLRAVTANLVSDHFKSAVASKRGARRPHAELSEVREAAAPDTLERTYLLQQMEDLLPTEPPEQAARDRLIFRLYYRVGLTARAIAALPDVGMNIKSVESVLHRLTTMLREAVTVMPGKGKP